MPRSSVRASPRPDSLQLDAGASERRTIPIHHRDSHAGVVRSRQRRRILRSFRSDFDSQRRHRSIRRQARELPVDIAISLSVQADDRPFRGNGGLHPRGTRLLPELRTASQFDGVAGDLVEEPKEAAPRLLAGGVRGSR